MVDDCVMICVNFKMRVFRKSFVDIEVEKLMDLWWNRVGFLDIKDVFGRDSQTFPRNYEV